MWILDRYILRQFLQTFFICLMSLTGLFIVFDAFTNLDEFLRCGNKTGGVLALFVTHYSFQSLSFFDRTSGLLTLVAAMFTVTWIQHHNEMTALMSAGISRVRVIGPVFVAAFAIIAASAASRELLMPRYSEQLARRPQDLVGDVAQKLAPQYDNETDVLIRGKGTYGDRMRISKPNFLLPPGLDRHGKLLIAEDAFYLPPEGKRPGGYLLDGVKQPKDLASRESLMLEGQPIVVTPPDAAGWLGPNQCFVKSGITFDQLTGGRAWRQFASTRELIDGLNNRSNDFGADVRVAIHARLVKPFLDLTLLFLGLPWVLSRKNRNVFLAIGQCGAIVTIFMIVEMAFQYMGAVYIIQPSIAAWAPLAIFVPIAVYLSDAMWK